MMHNLNETGRRSGSFNQNNLYSRRSFLKQAVVMAAGLMVPGLLTACSNAGAVERTGPPSSGKSLEQEAQITAVCEATTELSTLDHATRKALNYVDQSPEPDKFCANCRFFKQPAANTACGGCEVVGGPIDPKGHCTTWVALG